MVNSTWWVLQRVDSTYCFFQKAKVINDEWSHMIAELYIIYDKYMLNSTWWFLSTWWILQRMDPTYNFFQKAKVISPVHSSIR